MKIENLVKKYVEVKAQYDSLDTELKSLREQICEYMEENSVTSVENSKNVIKLRVADVKSYKDSFIAILKKIAPQCIVESLDTKKVKVSVEAGVIDAKTASKYEVNQRRKSLVISEK